MNFQFREMQPANLAEVVDFWNSIDLNHRYPVFRPKWQEMNFCHGKTFQSDHPRPA